jgi:heptosyltransferase-1
MPSSVTTPSKILLVRFSALGDVIQTVPILSMLRESFPEAKIGWAIDAELVPTVEGHPSLDYIHACHRRRWSKSLTDPAKWPQTSKEISQFIGDIKAIGYDVAIDAQGLLKTAVVPFFAGIKRRIGYSHGRESSSLFYTERYLSLQEYFDPTVLHLDHMALLAKAMGAENVRHSVQAPVVAQEIKDRMKDAVATGFRNTAPLIAMAPATQWESKAWPMEHWVALLDDILTHTPLNVVMVGAKGDVPIVQRVLQAFPQRALTGRVMDLSGKTSIPEMYALYEFVDAAVGSDSAPLHIAGAVKTPHLFGIFGPTGYRRTPPIGSKHIKLFSTEIDRPLPCQPCHKRTCPLGTTECMTSIRPKDVFRAIHQALCSEQPINEAHKLSFIEGSK